LLIVPSMWCINFCFVGDVQAIRIINTGFARLSVNADNLKELILEADSALYGVKKVVKTVL